ncbi:helix-turn-helix transcriptional regulator [Halobacteriales archaeon Cl-PHB]
MDNIEALNFLTGSGTRWDILLELSEEPRSFGDLRTDLDVPQSTLNRNLSKLREEGWVREGADRNYHLTNLGTFFVDRIRPIADVMTVVDNLAEYPDAFPLQEFDFDVSRLADANWRTASPNEPYSVINRVRSIFEDATQIHGYRPHYNPAYIDVTARVAQKPDAEVLGMVPEHQLDAANADRDFEKGQFDDVPTVEFRVWDGDVDYALGIVDDETVVLTGHHEGGMPSLMVESTDAAVLDWAQREFQKRLDRSEPAEIED